MQVPPQVSAVKVDGERAYDLARDGVQMDLKARPLWVERLAIIAHPDADHVELEMTCGKGGYVRAIARDLGRAVGTFGHALWLRRTAVGPFDLAQAQGFADVAAGPQDTALLPLEAALPDDERLDVTAEQAKDISHGRRILGFPGKSWAAYQGQAIALGHIEGAEFVLDRVLNR
jgi:tRNA pseudouridine55 synthase